MDDRPTPPTFETNRLQLRTLLPGDPEFLADLQCDSDVMKFIHSGALPRDKALKYAEAEIELAHFRWQLHKFIVELREGRTRIAWVELAKFRGVFDPDEKWKGDDVNLGFEFDKGYWGQGFACEAAGPTVAYAFDTLQLKRLVANAHKDNVGSMRVLEKLGFQQRGTRRRSDMDGQECRLFSLAAADWERESTNPRAAVGRRAEDS